MLDSWNCLAVPANQNRGTGRIFLKAEGRVARADNHFISFSATGLNKCWLLP